MNVSGTGSSLQQREGNTITNPEFVQEAGKPERETRASQYLQSSRRSGSIYENPVETVVSPPGALLKIVRKMLTAGAERVPRIQMGPFSTNGEMYRQSPASGLRVTWLGHSTMLLEVDGTTVLTDPVWAPRASPVAWIGPRRFYPPPLALELLPPIDLVLLSHDHFDHLDAGTIRKLSERTPLFLCSLGMGRHLGRWGVPREKIRELDWTESCVLSRPAHRAAEAYDPLTITALPARHFSGRISRRNRTLWSSFVLRTAQHCLYFGADTGYFPGFAEIGAEYGPFDLTMLEIGASDALWPDIHLGPAGAIQAYLELRGNLDAGPLLPIHWGLFNLALHPWYEPVESLIELAREALVPLLLPAPGTPVELAPFISQTEPPDPVSAGAWWAPFKS